MLFKSIVLALGALASFASASASAPTSQLEIRQAHSVAARELAKTIHSRDASVQADIDALVALDIQADVLVNAIVNFAAEIDLNLDIILDIINKKHCNPSPEILAIVDLFVHLKLDLHLLIGAKVNVGLSLKGDVVVEALVRLALSIGIELDALVDAHVDAHVAAFIDIIVAIQVRVEVFVAVGINLHIAKRALLDVAAMGSMNAVQSKRDAQFARALATTGATDIAAHLARRNAAVGLDVQLDVDVGVAVFVDAIVELFATLHISLDVIAEIVKKGQCGCGERREIVAVVALFAALDLNLEILVHVSLAVGELKGELVAKALATFALALEIDVETLGGVDLGVDAEAFVTLLAAIDIKIGLFVKVCAEIDLRRRAIEFLA